VSEVPVHQAASIMLAAGDTQHNETTHGSIALLTLAASTMRVTEKKEKCVPESNGSSLK